MVYIQFLLEMSKRLYVGNLSYSTTDAGLKDSFSAGGITVEDANVIIDKMTGRSRGFGFVTVADGQEQKAIEMWHGKELDGRALVVNEARPQAERPPRGGGNRF